MDTKTVKAKIHKSAEQIETGVESAAQKLADSADTIARKSDELHDDMAEMAKTLRENTKGFADDAAKRVREHPLASFGLAFVAGILVARALRR